jgi:protein-export membrane protein SecD
MLKQRIIALGILAFGIVLSYFIYVSESKAVGSNLLPAKLLPNASSSVYTRFPFKLGLDLAGGTELVYKADISSLKAGEVASSLTSLRDVIERRINLFGVTEPIVLNEKSTLAGEERLLVQLPGVTNIDSAIAMIGQTPVLEFKTERPEAEKASLLKAKEDFIKAQKEGKSPTLTKEVLEDTEFKNTDLTGKYLEKSQVGFSAAGNPEISLSFNKEGAALFEKITSENVGKNIAIYLDGSAISVAGVREAISGGKASIQGNFTPQEAKTLVGRLNSGALPIPISLIGTNLVGPTLGAKASEAGVRAAIFGLLLVSLFLILWYRLPGLIATFSLLMYVAIVLTLFKLIPVTMTAPSIAGFIISIGLAVDANVLIFERMKEEIKNKKSVQEAIVLGFKRAWTSIRDSNISSLIIALVLFFTGTSIIKGFALTFMIGVSVSMLSAIVISRIILIVIAGKNNTKLMRILFSNGFNFFK